MRTWWRTVRAYLGAGGRRRRASIDTPAALQHFLASRASHVAQSTLYGYLKTRAGLRYFTIFDDDDFMVSMNIAKWQVWLACLSDLAVYAGGLVARAGGGTDAGPLMRAVVDAVLDETGVPAEAGPDFAAAAEGVRARVSECDWMAVGDDESAFATSPRALVRWAPVVEDLKALDAEIVMNSVRFRWHEVRRDLRRNLDAGALLGAFQATRSDPAERSRDASVDPAASGPASP